MAAPRGAGYCLVAKPVANSHACPATVQASINEANATFYALCIAEK